MLRVERPGPRVLVISQPPTGAAVRLAIWIGVVVTFYLVILGDAVLIEGHPAGNKSARWHEWLLLLFPLFLLPYLFSLVRALRRDDKLTFDGRSKVLSRGARSVAAFADVQELQLRSVHGTCEEFRLSAVLSNGRSIELLEVQASAAIEALAAEAAGLLEVELIRQA